MKIIKYPIIESFSASFNSHIFQISNELYYDDRLFKLSMSDIEILNCNYVKFMESHLVDKTIFMYENN